MTDQNLTEREIVRRHTVRTPGRKRFNDGLPELGTPEYELLDPATQLQIGEQRAGIFRPTEEDNGAATNVPPRPYGRDEHNPIDAKEW